MNNTLHLCNYSATNNPSKYFRFVQSGDAVIFYSQTITSIDFNNLVNSHSQKNKLYFIVDDNKDNIPTIGYERWVELVDKYKRTFTWK